MDAENFGGHFGHANWPRHSAYRSATNIAEARNIDVTSVTESSKKRRRIAGGAATGGGINYQAAVSAIAYVYMARGQQLSWLEKVAEDKKFLSKGQEKWKAPLPDYTLPGIKHEGLSTSAAGVIGTLITFFTAIIIAFLLKKKGKEEKGESNIVSPEKR